MWLILKSNLNRYCDQSHRRSEAANRLITKFFIFHGFDYSYRQNNVVGIHKSFASMVEHLFRQLNAAHAIDDWFDQLYIDEYIQHQYLCVNLKPYQIKTVKWMLNRERVLKYHEITEIKKRLNDDEGSTKFFFNSQTISLTIDPKVLQCMALPTGGILADEMGLGKTIEILDLILLNPRPVDENRFAGLLENMGEATEKPNRKQVKCLCAQSNCTTDTVCCTKCWKLQHRKCVSQRNSEITPDNYYICPACWEKPLQAKTTFIVSPRSIKMQWKAETDNRIQHGKISVI